MQSVHLYDETLSLSGIAEFLSAAATLTKIELDCMSSAAAARAEELLAGCTSVTSMSLDGQFTPSRFPAGITTLFVDFSEERGSRWEPAQAQLLVVGVSRLQQLQCLSLWFETLQPFQLTGNGQLPRLRDLAINTCVPYKGTGLGLSWIEQQMSCPSLELTVKVDEGDPLCHTAVLSQLLPLKVDKLCLELELVFPANLKTCGAGPRQVSWASQCTASVMQMGITIPRWLCLGRSASHFRPCPAAEAALW